jgi:sirohydrochlorin ferrochelatase
MGPEFFLTRAVSMLIHTGMTRTLLTLEEQIARDERRLAEKKARAARIAAAKGSKPQRKLAQVVRILRGLEKSESGHVALECGRIAGNVDSLFGTMNGQAELPLEGNEHE